VVADQPPSAAATGSIAATTQLRRGRYSIGGVPRGRPPPRACDHYRVSGSEQERIAREWDAGSYDRVGAPLTARGLAVLERLELVGDETVLDAGCGTGRVTAALRERLPRGRVIALDGSRAMLAQARRNLGAERVTYVHADLGGELPLEPGSVDAIVSTSTLHWVQRHDAVFRRFAEVLRPGGMLVVDCGGRGNVASLMAALEAAGERWSPWNFTGPEQSEADLRAAGFDPVRTWLSDDPVDVPPERLHEYLRTVMLGSHLRRLGDEEGERLVAAVARALPSPRMDDVRLNIVARRRA
jgi:trans-aconitate 2-methyltransferase